MTRILTADEMQRWVTRRAEGDLAAPQVFESHEALRAELEGWISATKEALRDFGAAQSRVATLEAALRALMFTHCAPGAGNHLPSAQPYDEAIDLCVAALATDTKDPQ